jgi:hypothetical protein
LAERTLHEARVCHATFPPGSRISARYRRIPAGSRDGHHVIVRAGPGTVTTSSFGTVLARGGDPPEPPDADVPSAEYLPWDCHHVLVR